MKNTLLGLFLVTISAVHAASAAESKVSCSAVAHLACSTISEQQTLAELSCGLTEKLMEKTLDVKCKDSVCGVEFSDEKLAVQMMGGNGETGSQLEDKITGQSQTTFTTKSLDIKDRTLVLSNKKGGLLGNLKAYSIVVQCH